MSKRLFVVALFCLHVLPLNTFAASASDSEIDAIIETSKSEANKEVLEKLLENQKLANEIHDIEKQIADIRANQSSNTTKLKKHIIIGTTTLIGTGLAVTLLKKTGKYGEGAIFNLIIAYAIQYVGAAGVVYQTAQGGYQYYLIKLDEKKIPELQKNLQDLQAKLQKQNDELSSKLN